MDEGGTNDSGREDRLNEILLEYLRAEDAGLQPDPRQWIARYPEYARELAEYFEDQQRVEAFGSNVASSQGEESDARQADESGDEPTTPFTGRVAPPPGTRVRYVGDYELLEEIARGGMGVVYKARQLSLNRIVAIKMILAGRLANEEDIRRFHAEAQSAAALDHPGIVPIYEVGEHDGHHYFSMGYVEGKSLARVLNDSPLPARRGAELTLKIAQAVQYAHEQGVIHRDLKPGNVQMLQI